MPEVRVNCSSVEVSITSNVVFRPLVVERIGSRRVLLFIPFAKVQCRCSLSMHGGRSAHASLFARLCCGTFCVVLHDSSGSDARTPYHRTQIFVLQRYFGAGSRSRSKPTPPPNE
ncbi:unnamed protein product, partial [Pylaiella littoralis]